MRILLLCMAAITTLLFSACGSDDDGAKQCEACSIVLVDFNICDNGNGTADVTTTTLGITNTETESFEEGQTFEEFVAERCPANINLP